MTEPREECFRCMKPARMCLCGRISRLPNRTYVLVVQHPRERAHPIGTARFVELGLDSSEVVVAHDLDASAALAKLGGRRAVLLHPSATSRPLDSFVGDERPEVLVVVDGTWPNARTLVRENPELAALPHAHLAPASPSRYRIRREPSLDSVSTLEATLLALTELEPGLDTEPLLGAFDAMIDDQLAAHGGGRDGARRRGGNRAFVGVPVELGERFESLAIVYAESSLRDDAGHRTLLRISVHHPSSGALFDAFVAPKPGTRIPLGLPELEAPEGALPLPQLRLELLRWLMELEASTSAPITLGAFSGELARRVASLVDRPAFDLGAAYRAMRGKGHGMLDAILEREAIRAPRVALEGRAGGRLGDALALATWLRDRARARGEARAVLADGL